MRVLLAIALGAATAAPLTAQTAPARAYYAWVASEAVDKVQLLRYDRAGLAVERTFTLGVLPTDPDGPHGVAVSPDGKHLFVSTGHGTPNGSLWKFSTRDDRQEGRVELGAFPATLQVSPDGHLAYVVNFNLHGEMEPSSVSVVATDEMVEILRIPTCIMPHGSRLNRQGTRHYSACMMDDLLVEIDTRSLGVSRRLNAGSAPYDSTSHGAHTVTCSPTWAQPSPDGRRVYVACNKSNEIVVVDVEAWRIVRRWAAGPGVYNLATTSDGRSVLATNKRGQSVSIFDAGTGREVARIPSGRKVVHGVAVTPDDRYAFISIEGIGSEPGRVEVVDLGSRKVVAGADVGPMAGGIDVWNPWTAAGAGARAAGGP